MFGLLSFPRCSSGGTEEQCDPVLESEAKKNTACGMITDPTGSVLVDLCEPCVGAWSSLCCPFSIVSFFGLILEAHKASGVNGQCKTIGAWLECTICSDNANVSMSFI